MNYTEIEPMMNTNKLRDISEFERPSVLINPIIDIKPYEDQDFYDRCLEFRNNFIDLNKAIIEVENHVKIVNARCERMNNLVHLMDLSGDLKDEIDSMVRKFVEYYDIQNIEKKMNDLYSTRNAMLNVIRLFCTKTEHNMCTLCLENSINVFNIPCGHTMCSTCTQKNTAFTCPFCRAKVDKVGNLFLG